MQNSVSCFSCQRPQLQQRHVQILMFVTAVLWRGAARVLCRRVLGVQLPWPRRGGASAHVQAARVGQLEDQAIVGAMWHELT